MYRPCSLKMTLFQLLSPVLSTVQSNLPLHQFTRRVRFSERMVKVFRVFLHVKLENLKCRLTVRGEIELGNFEFSSSVISFKVCRLFDFTHLRILRSTRASVFLGRPLEHCFHWIRVLCIASETLKHLTDLQRCLESIRRKNKMAALICEMSN
jgi:hypothetical protein